MSHFEQPLFGRATVLHLGRDVLGVHGANVEKPFETLPEEGVLLVDAARLERRVDGVAKFLTEHFLLALQGRGDARSRRRCHLEEKHSIF